MALRQQLVTMARYNAWATARTLHATETLTDEEYYRDVGLFFKSVHGTLNHILVAEHEVWYPRIHDRVSPQGVALNKESESDRLKLRALLITNAEHWVPLLSSNEAISDQELEGEFRYHDLSGRPASLSFAATLSHVFNHGTHHRGQISAALTMLRHPSPELDLVYMLHEDAKNNPKRFS